MYILRAKMKFMKLGSKPDQFQTDGDTDTIRLVNICHRILASFVF